MNAPHPLIEELLQRFQSTIGVDYDRYRNHVYRVFLNCFLLDGDENNGEKYAIAAVFHDIGIWTNHTFDYLNPSIEQVNRYLTTRNKQDWINELSLMISWHHKLSTYQGASEKLVETFRRADWIDVSVGFLTFGADKQAISDNRKRWPNRGFHLFLVRQTAKNFVKHPLNPVPVFKR